jgi:hypothetical protein
VARAKVSIYLRIRQPDGKQPYCPAIWETKKTLRPHWCLVQRVPEHHSEGTYHLRYRVYGKRVWESAGDDPISAVSLRDSRLFQLKHPNSQQGEGLAARHKSPAADESTSVPERLRIADEVKTYLSNCEKLSAKTHAAYKLSLTLFQQSCTKTFLDQIRKQDLQAFDTFPTKRGDDDRTRSNRVGHIVTFLRNQEDPRQNSRQENHAKECAPPMDGAVCARHAHSPRIQRWQTPSRRKSRKHRCSRSDQIHQTAQSSIQTEKTSALSQSLRHKLIATATKPRE